jgi:DNA-binding NtrC family response regulator
MDSNAASDKAEWLRNPLVEKRNRLLPMRELMLKPYNGPKRRLKIYRTSYLIGSGPDCEIRVDDPFVSEVHAELVLDAAGEGYSVRDRGSRNGVFLNGVRVQSAPLPAQGNLRLGRSLFLWAEAEAESMPEGSWVVADPLMRQTIENLKRMAASTLPVLILGETGTGKDMLARLLHLWGPQRSGPYVPINGALTGGTLAESELFGHRKGAFTGAESARVGALRSAHGGTLFLDEVGDIPPAAQVKLLRVLETGEVKALGSDQNERADFRLVSATSRSLDRRVSEGTFRLDLYYRLAGFVLQVPPLRERPQDVLAIARQMAKEKGLELDREAEGKLLSYSWPGNVRELKSCISRATVLATGERMPCVFSTHLIGLDLVRRSEALSALPRTLEQIERESILESLERNGWSRQVTARELGIARSTLFEKMRKFGIRDQVEKNAAAALTAASGSGYTPLPPGALPASAC